MPNSIILPPHYSSDKPNVLETSGQITIIGANGAGKTRFMHYLVGHNDRPAMILSALSAFFPSQSKESKSFIDRKYEEKIHKSLQREGLTQLDKLIQMLFHDEFESLLRAKADKILHGKPIKIKTSKLDIVIDLWQRIFPNNQIISEAGTLLFANESGDNLIGSSKLSSGEKTVLYYIAAVLYADHDSIICIDNPSMFLHPAILNTVWNAIEGLRQDCTFIYNTSDMEFINSRTGNTSIWVKGNNVHRVRWSYEIIEKGSLPEELIVDIMGSRRPVLFIEGDAEHSIDARLYPLVFPRFTVRPLGSCNKVIESTRAFNDLSNIHKLESRGLVDRDRRTEEEVDYLRRKNIMVPEVAEIENIFLVENVIKTMAVFRHKNPGQIFQKVKKSVLKMFATHFREQALLHVRHKMKRALEYRGDVKVKSIEELERHLESLPRIIDVRKEYDFLLKTFSDILKRESYAEILKFFNYKPVLPESRVANLLGYKDKDSYISGVLGVLKGRSPYSEDLRKEMLKIFMIGSDD